MCLVHTPRHGRRPSLHHSLWLSRASMPALHITQALDSDPQAWTWDHHQTQTPDQAHVVFLQLENRKKCYSPFKLLPGPFQALRPISLGLTLSDCCCPLRSLHWPLSCSLCAISSLSTQTPSHDSTSLRSKSKAFATAPRSHGRDLLSDPGSQFSLLRPL